MSALARPAGVRVISDPNVIGETLIGHDLDLYRDHAGFAAARHVLVVEGDRWCWVVFRMDRRKKLPPVFASILHVSDPAVLRRQMRSIGGHLLVHHRAVAMLAEPRVIGPLRVRPTFTLRSSRRRMFLSSTMSANEVDSFYSELMCLSW